MKIIREKLFKDQDYQSLSIKDVQISESVFSNTNLDTSILTNVRFSNCKFLGTSFIYSSFTNVEFLGCSVEECYFMGSDFKDVKFINSIVKNNMFNQSTFDSVELGTSEFLDNILSGLNIVGALEGVNFIRDSKGRLVIHSLNDRRFHHTFFYGRQLSVLARLRERSWIEDDYRKELLNICQKLFWEGK